jgi:uncharacterized protein (TIGR02118 family)
MRLIVIFKQPLDPAAFDEAFFNSHLPLLKKMSGLQRVTVSKFDRALIGENYYLITELVFSDSNALRVALKSPEMVAAAQHLETFADGLVSLMVAEDQSPATSPPL